MNEYVEYPETQSLIRAPFFVSGPRQQVFFSEHFLPGLQLWSGGAAAAGSLTDSSSTSCGRFPAFSPSDLLCRRISLTASMRLRRPGLFITGYNVITSIEAFFSFQFLRQKRYFFPKKLLKPKLTFYYFWTETAFNMPNH